MQKYKKNEPIIFLFRYVHHEKIEKNERKIAYIVPLL